MDHRTKGGRIRGARVVSWHHSEKEKLFRCLMENCPPVPSGDEFLTDAMRAVPTRSRYAIQSYISKHLQRAIAEELFYRVFRSDFSLLTPKQERFLTKFMVDEPAFLRAMAQARIAKTRMAKPRLPKPKNSKHQMGSKQTLGLGSSESSTKFVPKHTSTPSVVRRFSSNTPSTSSGYSSDFSRDGLQSVVETVCQAVVFAKMSRNSGNPRTSKSGSTSHFGYATEAACFSRDGQQSDDIAHESQYISDGSDYLDDKKKVKSIEYLDSETDMKCSIDGDEPEVDDHKNSYVDKMSRPLHQDNEDENSASCSSMEDHKDYNVEKMSRPLHQDNEDENSDSCSSMEDHKNYNVEKMSRPLHQDYTDGNNDSSSTIEDKNDLSVQDPKVIEAMTALQQENDLVPNLDKLFRSSNLSANLSIATAVQLFKDRADLPYKAVIVDGQIYIRHKSAVIQNDESTVVHTGNPIEKNSPAEDVKKKDILTRLKQTNLDSFELSIPIPNDDTPCDISVVDATGVGERPLRLFLVNQSFIE